MVRDLFSLREKEIFNTLKELENCNFVIIGGYAVNAYALPRFSVDCDIVIKDNDESRIIEKKLLKIGYNKILQKKELPYSGYFARYEKKLENNFLVSVDVLIKEVIDRNTKTRFSADWIFDNSSKLILKGKTIIEELKLRIINIDALLVMKIISCRPTDIRDVFMLLPNADNTEWIKSEISDKYDFNNRINKIIEKVNSKQFKDGLSGVYGRFDEKAFEKHKKALLNLQSLTLQQQ